MNIRNRIYLRMIVSIILIAVMILPNYLISVAEESHEFVKIGLNYILASPSNTQITGDDDLAIWDFQGNKTFYVLDNVKYVAATINDDVLRVKDSSNNDLNCDVEGVPVKVSEMLLNGYTIVSSNYLDYLNSDLPDFNSVIKIDGKEYRGGISFYINENNTFTLINRLSIDEYTYGVINGEMNYSNPIEALKAQAVVARSYALTNLNRHEYSGYDLCDSTHCQVYKGYSDENSKSNMAVNETKNLGIYYKGVPVAAYFSKNSGGYTQNVEDVWNSNLGYLRGIKDIYSPSYTWKAQFTFSEIESKLRAAGNNVGNLKSIMIVNRNSSGSVASLKFEGDQGSVTIEKEKIRTILGMSLIKSTKFTINDKVETNDLIQSVYVRGSSLSEKSDEGLYVLDASGKTVKLNMPNAYMIDGKLTCIALKDETSDSRVTGGMVYFNGSGSGHAVGLPQDSAIEMAKQGFLFKEILNYFYTDIEIK